MSIASHNLGDAIWQQSPFSLCLRILLLFLGQRFVSFSYGSYIVEIFVAINSTIMCFNWLQFSITIFLCFKEQFPCWGVRTTPTVGSNIENRVRIIPVSALVVVGSPRSTILLALNSWLGIQYWAWFPSFWVGINASKALLVPTNVFMPLALYS